jgi:hypothetical protein
MYAVMCCKAHENLNWSYWATHGGRVVKKSEGISDQLRWDARRLDGSESVCRRSSHKKADKGKLPGKVKVRGRESEYGYPRARHQQTEMFRGLSFEREARGGRDRDRESTGVNHAADLVSYGAA